MVESRAVLGGVGDEARQWYVEEIGLIFERGVPRMVGRVFGVLVISEVPELSAEELAGAWRASQGPISTTTHMLEQIGIIERVGRPGECRDYFRNKPGTGTTLGAASWGRSRLCAGWPRRG